MLSEGLQRVAEVGLQALALGPRRTGIQPILAVVGEQAGEDDENEAGEQFLFHLALALVVEPLVMRGRFESCPALFPAHSAVAVNDLLKSRNHRCRWRCAKDIQRPPI